MHPVGTMTWRSDLKVLIVLFVLSPFIFYAGFLHAKNKADKVLMDSQSTRQEIVDEAFRNTPLNRDDRIKWLRNNMERGNKALRVQQTKTQQLGAGQTN